MIVKPVERWRVWARALKRDTYALYLAAKDPRTPWYVKALAFVVVSYAFSPIDLIPDFVPVIGYLDDLLLVPVGILLLRWLTPDIVWRDAQAAAQTTLASGRPWSRAGLIGVVAVWVLALVLAALFVRRIVAG